ncbi:MAG: hypothetical protein DHS20C03_36130 [Minwuia thermotolerans]|nr:MAG: hypothetical protein DHS20C03_36130 [Minwuia thermotolerans]
MTDPFEAARKITPEALAQLGQPQIAYVKPVENEQGLKGFGIFSASGQQVGVAPTRETAFIAVRQHEMQPVHVH